MAEAEAAGVAPLVDLVLEDPRWEAAGLEAVATSAARAALLVVGRDPAHHELSLLACDDARIAGLNETFRGAAKPTNVLSWPAFEGAVPLPGGDGAVFLGDMGRPPECLRNCPDHPPPSPAKPLQIPRAAIGIGYRPAPVPASRPDSARRGVNHLGPGPAKLRRNRARWVGNSARRRGIVLVFHQFGRFSH